MMPTISSIHNAHIKALLALATSRARKKQQLFTIEGKQEMELALAAGYTFKKVFFCPAIAEDNVWLGIGIPHHILVPVSQPVFAKIAYRKTTGGAVAIAAWKPHSLNELSLSKSPLILVLNAVEKPGNLGALLRTAEAANIDAVLVCDFQTDIYNPNVIRSSVGCLFTRQIISTTSQEALLWLISKRINIYTTSLEGGTPYRQVNYRKPCALIMGSESTGVDAAWKTPPARKITIPMHSSRVDSLNVSVSAAIIIFEALRQREGDSM